MSDFPPCPLQLESADASATEAIASRIADLLQPGDVILLEGPLGAGKTCFARAMLRAACGDPGLEVPSPTYTLVQTYSAPARWTAGGAACLSLAHFDLWRLVGPAALTELGWEEARRGVVIVEWPDRLGVLRPDEALSVELFPVAGSESRRRLRLSGWPGRIDSVLAATRPFALAPAPAPRSAGSDAVDAAGPP